MDAGMSVLGGGLQKQGEGESVFAHFPVNVVNDFDRSTLYRGRCKIGTNNF